MSLRKHFSTILALETLLTPLVFADRQIGEQAARELARNVARAELSSTVHFKSDQFLNVRRDEELEQALAIAANGRRDGLVFIYKISPDGIEIRDNAIVHHITTDGDPALIVAVRSANGGTYRIHGFGRGESRAEFEKLLTELKVQVTSPDQAEAVADLYRKVNPESYEDLAPILRLIELKQAAERQCQGVAKSFDAGERAFDAWWKHAEPLYAPLPFRQKVVSRGKGYLVEWIVLSSPSAENCGGAPLRAQLEVSADGHVSKTSVSLLQE